MACRPCRQTRNSVEDAFEHLQDAWHPRRQANHPPRLTQAPRLLEHRDRGRHEAHDKPDRRTPDIQRDDDDENRSGDEDQGPYGQNA